MAAELFCQDLHICRRIRDGGDGLVSDLQLFPSAGALPVVAGGVAVQRLGELLAVVDQNCPEADHPLVEVRQQLQEIRPLVAVPQDAGLVLIEPVILRQGGRVPGPQLAEGRVHEPPAGGGALPDEIQVVRTEEHGVVHLAQGSVVFCRHLIHPQFPPPVPIQLHPGPELPVPGEDPALQNGGGGVKADHLPVRPGPGGLPTGEIDDGLQQVGLALGVLPEDHVAGRVKGDLLMLVVAELLESQLKNLHRTPCNGFPERPRRPPGGSFCPAWCRPRR